MKVGYSYRLPCGHYGKIKFIYEDTIAVEASQLGQIVEIKRIEVEIEEIQGCFPAPIVARGDSFYIRLDPRFVKFWELQKGDELLVTITQVKREREAS